MYTKGTSKYEISNLGRVRTVRTGRILKHAVDRWGYHSVVIYPRPQVRMFALVHRLVAFAFVPNLDCEKEVNHKSGNKSDNYSTNLEWVSPRENMRHAYSLGLKNNDHMKGERNPLSKLTPTDVRKIRQMKGSAASIARKFDVCPNAIFSIIKGITWTHVK